MTTESLPPPDDNPEAAERLAKLGDDLASLLDIVWKAEENWRFQDRLDQHLRDDA